MAAPNETASAQDNDRVSDIFDEIAVENGFVEFVCETPAKLNGGNNFMGIIAKVKIEGTTSEKNKEELNLIYKTAPSTAREGLRIDEIFRKEIFCYKKILPALYELESSANVEESKRFKSPKFYKASTEMEKEFIVLEDVTAMGFRLSDKKMSLSLPEMECAIWKLAGYHCLSFVIKKRDPEKYKTFVESCCETYITPRSVKAFSYYFMEQLKRAISVVDDASAVEILKKIFHDKICWDICDLVNKNADDAYAVVNHGDCWSSNFMFKYNANGDVLDAIILDYQMGRVASPVNDLYYLIFTSTEASLREKHFRTFFEIYRDNLKEHLKHHSLDIEEVYPEKIFEKDIKEQALWGLFQAVIIFPVITTQTTSPLEDVLLQNEKDAEEGIYSNQNNEYSIRMNAVINECIKLGYL